MCSDIIPAKSIKCNEKLSMANVPDDGLYRFTGRRKDLLYFEDIHGNSFKVALPELSGIKFKKGAQFNFQFK